MAFEAEGKLYKKFDTVQVTDKFKKREFVIEMEDGAYSQIVKFQLTQNNCDKLDPYNEGDMMKVTFSLRGREYTKDDKTSYFTNLDAWRLDKAGETVAAAPPAANQNFPSVEPAAKTSTETASMDDDLPF